MDVLSGTLGELLQGKKVDLAAVLKAIQERGVRVPPIHPARIRRPPKSRRRS